MGAAMKTSSAKAKGRRLQQKVVAALREFYAWPESDVRSIPMGAQGADVWLSSTARLDFPFAIECKNVEKINIWASWTQANANAKKEDLAPMLVFSRNNEETLVVLRLNDLLARGARP